MNLYKDFPERLIRCLRELGLDGAEIRVVPSDPPDAYKMDVFLVSNSFEGMDEAERQALVWGQVLQALDADDQRRIDFIFTDTPSERPLESLPARPA